MRMRMRIMKMGARSAETMGLVGERKLGIRSSTAVALFTDTIRVLLSDGGVAASITRDKGYDTNLTQRAQKP